MGELIEQLIDHSKFDYDVQFTEAKGHASVIAKTAISEGYERVIACGGDGTVNEVAKSLAHTQIPLGIIPAGSGNGFAMFIGMGRNIKRAIEKLNTASAKCIDSCEVNNQFFLNLAGVGFDALIAYKVDSGQKRGFQMYLKKVSQEMLKFKAQKFHVEMDDKNVDGNFTTIAIANAAMYGYNFTIAPTADLTDGLMDIVFIHEAPLIKTISASWRMLNKSLEKSSLVSIKRCKEVIISTDNPYYFHLDGESFSFEEKLHFKINPASINILFPKNGHL